MSPEEQSFEIESSDAGTVKFKPLTKKELERAKR